MTSRVGPDAIEGGFTLVELLVTMVITGILIVALADALSVGLRSTADNSTHLSQSDGEQLLANWLEVDVEAACNSSTVVTCARNPNPTTSGVAACTTSVSAT